MGIARSLICWNYADTAPPYYASERYQELLFAAQDEDCS